MAVRAAVVPRQQAGWTQRGRGPALTARPCKLPATRAVRPRRAGAEQAALHLPPGVIAVDGDLAFNQPHRSTVEQQLRTPHRVVCVQSMCGVVAHWAAEREGVLPLADFSVGVADPGDKHVDCPAQSGAAPANTVDARALICCGMRPLDSADSAANAALQRISVLTCMRRSDGSAGDVPSPLPAPVPMAFGGEVEAGSDAVVTQQLAALVEQQCGLDLSAARWHKFLELLYDDGPATVFYVPALWATEEEELAALPQVKLTKQTVEEEYEDEEVDEVQLKRQQDDLDRRRKEREEAMLEGADVPDDVCDLPPPLKKVRRTREVERAVRHTVLEPSAVPLQRILQHPLRPGDAKETIELCAAADSVHEFLKREMGTRILAVLREKRRCAQERGDAARRRAEQKDSRKRKRQQQAESAKRARLEQEERLREVWREEDEGKTDEDMQESSRLRQEQLRAMREEHREQDKQLLLQELKAIEEDEKVEGTRIVVQTDERALQAFAFFDPSGRGQVSRLRVENLLLALDPNLTMGDVGDLLSMPEVPSRSLGVPYAGIVAFEREVPEG